MTDEHHRTIRSFAKRSGRLTASQKRALDELRHQHCIPFQKSVTDFSSYFNKEQPLIIEIGFGNGDSLASMAQANPDYNYLGIEVYTAGIGRCLLHIEKMGLTNLKLIEHDAVEVMHHMVADNSVHGFQIYFPDPWHKKRHHKRRLIQPAFITLLCSKLKANGFIHCATDWEHYAEQMLNVLSDNTSLTNQYQGFAPRPHWRPLTKFEKRGENLQHQVWDLLFEKSANI